MHFRPLWLPQGARRRHKRDLLVWKKEHSSASADLFTTDNSFADLVERFPAKGPARQEGSALHTDDSRLFVPHSVVTSCIPAMFLTLSHCAGDGVLYEATLCYNTSYLWLVFEIEVFIVMQIGPDLTCVTLFFTSRQGLITVTAFCAARPKCMRTWCINPLCSPPDRMLRFQMCPANKVQLDLHYVYANRGWPRVLPFV